MESKTKYIFVVEVECDDYDDATTVMAERIGYDEDYGFEYRIRWYTLQPT